MRWAVRIHKATCQSDSWQSCIFWFRFGQLLKAATDITLFGDQIRSQTAYLRCFWLQCSTSTSHTESVFVLLQYLSVLGGDLEEECQAAVVKVVIQGNKGSMHAAFQQDVGIVSQAYALHPADDALITPHQYICTDEHEHNTNLLAFGFYLDRSWFVVFDFRFSCLVSHADFVPCVSPVPFCRSWASSDTWCHTVNLF